MLVRLACAVAGEAPTRNGLDCGGRGRGWAAISQARTSALSTVD